MECDRGRYGGGCRKSNRQTSDERRSRLTQDVAASARAASEAQETWAAMPYEARAAIFRKAARIVEENGEEFAEWIIRETGASRRKRTSNSIWRRGFCINRRRC